MTDLEAVTVRLDLSQIFFLLDLFSINKRLHRGSATTKKQQMRWTKKSAHLLLQTRTWTLDGTLRQKFEQWYPGLAANDDQLEMVEAA